MVQAPPRRLQHDAGIPLVKDDEVNRAVALAMLLDFGLAVDTTAAGREALAKAQARAYDLLLMDMQMPVMNYGGCALRPVIDVAISWPTG